MKRKDYKRRELVQSQRADIVVHVRRRRDGGEDADRSSAFVFSLEMSEGENYVFGVGVVRESFLLELMGNENRGSSAYELDQMESVDGDGVFFRRTRGVEKVYDGWTDVGPADAREDSDFGIVLGMHEVSFLVSSVFPFRIVQDIDEDWNDDRSEKNSRHYKCIHLEIYNLQNKIVFLNLHAYTFERKKMYIFKKNYPF